MADFSSMEVMNSIIDRLSRSVAQRGVAETLRLCASEASWKVLPKYRRLVRQREKADALFDKTYGVDTGGAYRPKQDEVKGSNWSLGVSYQATDPELFQKCLHSLNLRYEDFTLLEIGSGKGRIVLLSSTYPFKKIVGVEYCHQLYEIARDNLERFPAAARRCADIELVEADATEYPIPADNPLLIFMNNPFAEPLMKVVVDKVVASHNLQPRRIALIYFWPFQARVWEQSGLFKRLQDSPAIFDTARTPHP